MAVNYQHATAFRGSMDELINTRKYAEERFQQTAVVMISGQDFDSRATTAPGTDFVNYALLRSAPVPQRTGLPAIDDVAHEVKILGLVISQEVE
jgi:hypothetical protein